MKSFAPVFPPELEDVGSAPSCILISRQIPRSVTQSRLFEYPDSSPNCADIASEINGYVPMPCPQHSHPERRMLRMPPKILVPLTLPIAAEIAAIHESDVSG